MNIEYSREDKVSLLVSVKIAQTWRFASSNERLHLITSCCLGNETTPILWGLLTMGNTDQTRESKENHHSGQLFALRKRVSCGI